MVKWRFCCFSIVLRNQRWYRVLRELLAGSGITYYNVVKEVEPSLTVCPCGCYRDYKCRKTLFRLFCLFAFPSCCLNILMYILWYYEFIKIKMRKLFFIQSLPRVSIFRCHTRTANICQHWVLCRPSADVLNDLIQLCVEDDSIIRSSDYRVIAYITGSHF